MKKITIWHTNDVHSQFEDFSAIVHYIRKHINFEKDFLLDAGDFCDQKSVMINGTHGVGGIELLKSAGYDAMAIGNNEFFAGMEYLEEMTNQNFPLLSANLFRLNKEPISGVLPFITLTRSGVRVLIIGISPYWGESPESTAFTDMCGMKLLEPTSLVQKILEQEKGNYDISILLSHGGIKKDREIAETVNGLDCIIGGHSHTEMDAAECINGTWIHQSGCWAKYLGKLTLELDDDYQVVSASGESIIVEKEKDSAIESVIAQQTEIAIAELSKVLYVLPQDLEFSIEHECMAMNVLADMMWKTYPSDLALINHGILSKGISREVTKLNLLEVSPSPLNLTTVVWSGKQIKDAIFASQKDEYIHMTSNRWSGFRGTELGTIAVSYNVEVNCDSQIIKIDGIPLDEEKCYRVITSDFLQRGSGYEMLGESLKETNFAKEYFRDLLEMKLNDLQFIESAQVIRFHRGKL
ncbi:MAG: bifunctional metallophosphatase/5'-nucleotidase [Solobacterium sp.]|nr:bifunctional metallophosphatase/5'-nucleotidase [Solobacterium sp.]